MPRTTQAKSGPGPATLGRSWWHRSPGNFPPTPISFPSFKLSAPAGVNWKDRTLYLSPEGCDLWGATWKGYQVAELVARFNAGERWLAKKEPGQVASTA